jgi:hypothetical protein
MALEDLKRIQRHGPNWVRAGTFSGTTDATGFLVVTHHGGFKPEGVIVQGISPIAGANIFNTAITDSYTATTFRLRAVDNTGTALNAVAITGCFYAFAGGG